MEVHHHSHTARKKWTHYFWEFLMLFLAVFCGFLAENQREHIVESHRAKEYAKSLLSDLKEDTTEILSGIRQNAYMVRVFDSCISIGIKYLNQQAVPGTFYYYCRFTSNAYSLDWNRSTLTQLIQSGNLRYFKNKELVDLINKYYATESLISSNNETDLLHRAHIRDLRSKLLLAEYYRYFVDLNITVEMNGHVANDTIDKLMSQQLETNRGEKGIMDDFINNIIERKARNRRYVEEQYPQALNEAGKIIELIKKEYHLK